MISTILVVMFAGVVGALILTVMGIGAEYIGRRIIKMNYKKFINDVYEELRIVLSCIFVVGYIIGSIIVFICTWATDKLDHADSDYTIDLEILDRKMRLTTKERI